MSGSLCEHNEVNIVIPNRTVSLTFDGERLVKPEHAYIRVIGIYISV